MKWIFFSLLAVNLAYLCYWLAVDGPAMQSPGLAVESRPTIRLLAERVSPAERSGDVKAAPAPPVAVTRSHDAPCMKLGPFDDMVSAQEVAGRFNDAGIPVGLQAVDKPTGEFDYRVAMPTLPSLQEAFRRLRELRSQDIEGHVITRGEDAQGISLGVFSSAEAAAAHRKNLEREGYQVVTREIPRAIREYWLWGRRQAAWPPGLVGKIQLEHKKVTVTGSACF